MSRDLSVAVAAETEPVVEEASGFDWPVLAMRLAMLPIGFAALNAIADTMQSIRQDTPSQAPIVLALLVLTLACLFGLSTIAARLRD